jgi:hypothetical protein
MRSAKEYKYEEVLKKFHFSIQKKKKHIAFLT